MYQNRVVVTGIGLVTPAGNSVSEFQESMYRGRSGIQPIHHFDVSKSRTKIAATVGSFDSQNLISEKEKGRLDRAAQMGIVAAGSALKDAGLLSLGVVPQSEETGVVVGIATGSVHAVERIYDESFNHQRPYGFGVPMAMCHSTAAHISIKFGLKGFVFTVSTACSSGAAAIGLAFRAIQSGDSQRIVAGGVDCSITPSQLAIWDSLRVLSTCNDEPQRAIKPFSRNRDGLVLGEGAALLVLEELGSALSRGATIYGEIAGFGSSSDASHITRPAMEGEALAMARALRSAGIKPEQVDYINAHGTGTQFNDKTETEAIKQIFPGCRIPISSIKPVTGHMLGASSAAEFAASMIATREGLIPPTMNYEELDSECDLDYVVEGSRKADLNIVMSNAFAFGGHNAVLIARRLNGERNGIHV
ncbi:MAG TPA: beta-ketoacyl-[acyl-carrier-protein] synthase family protein [Candidatus Angelobacter sp.]|nr:beta-ketoacyl-[acyl-carrier-protein] synthase family protein [Candidatus Angelobacter sp.]